MFTLGKCFFPGGMVIATPSTLKTMRVCIFQLPIAGSGCGGSSAGTALVTLVTVSVRRSISSTWSCLLSLYPPQRLHLYTDLIAFSGRWSSKDLGEFSNLLLIVATGLACPHVGFRLPQGDRNPLARVGICQQKCPFESLLLLGHWHHRVAIDTDGLLYLPWLTLNRHYSCVHG